LTVGNTKKISERVAKVTGEVYQASLIEPTNAREMALQYFIRGGTVLRGNTTNGAKPKPHTLVTLFTRSRPGMYYSDNSEMEARVQLYRGGRLTMSEVAHKIWESPENESLQLDTQEIQNALESVIMDHKSSAGMAKEMLETRGTPSQKAFISGTGKKIRPITYIADFVYIENDQTVVEDCKGVLTTEYKLKKKLFQYVHYPLTIKETRGENHGRNMKLFRHSEN